MQSATERSSSLYSRLRMPDRPTQPVVQRQYTGDVFTVRPTLSLNIPAEIMPASVDRQPVQPVDGKAVTPVEAAALTEAAPEPVERKAESFMQSAADFELPEAELSIELPDEIDTVAIPSKVQKRAFDYSLPVVVISMAFRAAWHASTDARKDVARKLKKRSFAASQLTPAQQ